MAFSGVHVYGHGHVHVHFQRINTLNLWHLAQKNEKSPNLVIFTHFGGFYTKFGGFDTLLALTGLNLVYLITKMCDFYTFWW